MIDRIYSKIFAGHSFRIKLNTNTPSEMVEFAFFFS